MLARLVREHLQSPADAVVLALPRGGVPVGYEVAAELDAPLDVYVVRKLGVPGHEELAMGAIASGGTMVLDDRVVGQLAIEARTIDGVVAKETEELQRRERAYRADRPQLDVRGRTVVLVDDGLATGSTMRAAARAVRAREPGSIVVAVPVASAPTIEALRPEVDLIVAAATPTPFYAVGQAYADFSQTTDAEVRDLLSRAASAA